MESSPTVRIIRCEAPLAGPDLVSLLWHKGSPWVEDIKARMEGKLPGSIDRFFVAYRGEEMVAHAWYTVAQADRRLGLLGHVFTRPECRKQGLATRVMEAAMDDFHREGGKVMQLFTFNPLSVPFYERLGFEQVYQTQGPHSADWYMRHPAGADASFAARFSLGACRTRDLAPADLPQYCLLYNIEHTMRLKDRAQEIGLGVEAELTFITALGRIAGREGVCRVLDNGQTIVAAATLMRCPFAHQSHVGLIDCYAHPRFAFQLDGLMRNLLNWRESLGLEVVYALAVDEAKRRLFGSLGFAHRTKLEKHYKVEGRHFDCDVYGA